MTISDAWETPATPSPEETPADEAVDARGLFTAILFLLLPTPSSVNSGQGAFVLPPPLDVDAPLDPAGRRTLWLAEPSDTRWTVEHALLELTRGAFQPGKRPILGFGVDQPPHWIAFRVHNGHRTPHARRIEIRNVWIDRIDIHLLLADGRYRHLRLGDAKPFHQRPVLQRYPAVDIDWPPGTSLVLMRAQTPDPMVLPIAFGAPEDLHRNESLENYGYGALYGLVVGLLAFNLVLFLRLRSRVYLAYVGFLLAFLAMNLSYTGHGFWWLWPEAVRWQQWANVLFIALFGIAQLQFALMFLDTRRFRPRLWHASQALAGGMGLSVLMAAIVAGQGTAVFLAIATTMLLALVALMLGIHGLMNGQKGARLFVAACTTSLIGAIVTALSVIDWIPFTRFGYHMVEVGVAIEAVLLSIALSDRVREALQARTGAERIARTDPLTRIYNRRGFIEHASAAAREDEVQGRCSSCMLLDLDHFKQINDRHGHEAGDRALRRVSEAITDIIRKDDIFARWGGEEFVIYMPNTDEDAANRLAERIRETISTLSIQGRGELIRLTISIGVVSTDGNPGEHFDLEQLIREADHAMYHAKENGRNQVIQRNLWADQPGVAPARFH